MSGVSGLISQIIAGKGKDVWSISPGATVYEAIEMMAEKKAGALPVMKGRKLVGMISERDYTRKVILQGKASRKTAVEEIMSVKPDTLKPGDTVDTGLRIMTDKRVRHLPVVNRGWVIGIVSIGDLVKWVISAQQSQIKEMESYISGGY
jgi:CBS domain-containing protein